MIKSALALLGFMGVSLAVMTLSAWVTVDAIPDWYAALAKPSFTPPNWVFRPVWTTLYVMMALSAWLIWRERHWAHVRKPLVVWAVQLGVNGAWSFCFFGLHHPLLGGAVLVLLWGLVIYTIRVFWPIRGRAGALLVPYFFWLNYAAALNFAIILLNPA